MKPETLKALVAFVREVETAIEDLNDRDKPQIVELKDIGSKLRRMLNAEAAEQIAIAKLSIEDSMPHNDDNGTKVYMPQGKNPHAVALGSLGGKAGKGKAKARHVTSDQARKAVNVRWVKHYTRSPLMENQLVSGQTVMVAEGKYKGCILTYLRWDWISQKPVCQHSEYLDGLRVESVIPYTEPKTRAEQTTTNHTTEKETL